jgi:hypothetical protein
MGRKRFLIKREFVVHEAIVEAFGEDSRRMNNQVHQSRDIVNDVVSLDDPTVFTP